MDVDDGIRSKKPRRLSTIDRSTADRCQSVNISTYHRAYLTPLRLNNNNNNHHRYHFYIYLTSPARGPGADSPGS